MAPRTLFVLNAPRNPKNIGASARGMANFGFRDLAVVNPYAAAWRETRSAVAAEPVVKKAKKFSSLVAALKTSHLVIGTSAGSRRNADVRWIGLDEARSLAQKNWKAGNAVAVVFGSERSGLSNDDLTFCHYVLRIPTAEDCPSMNLSQAVAVVACALGRPAKDPLLKSDGAEHISVAHVERLVERGLIASEKTGLLKGWDLKRARARLRKTFFRWNLTTVDAALLHGWLGRLIK